LKKIRKKRKGRPVTGEQITAEVERLKAAHNLSNVYMYPSPDGQVHLGTREELNAVITWLPWDLIELAQQGEQQEGDDEQDTKAGYITMDGGEPARSDTDGGEEENPEPVAEPVGG